MFDPTIRKIMSKPKLRRLIYSSMICIAAGILGAIAVASGVVSIINNAPTAECKEYFAQSIYAPFILFYTAVSLGIIGAGLELHTTIKEYLSK